LQSGLRSRVRSGRIGVDGFRRANLERWPLVVEREREGPAAEGLAERPAAHHSDLSFATAIGLTQLRRIADVLGVMRRALNRPKGHRFGLKPVRLGAPPDRRGLLVITVGAALAAASVIGGGWCGGSTASAEVPAPGFVARSGYLKAYRYDSRLLADKPPYFSGGASASVPNSRVTDYAFFTNFETADPGLISEPSGCVGKYYSEWVGRYACQTVDFLSGSRLEGPFHTNDSARVEGSAEFGRAGADPPDVVEIDGGTYPEDVGGQCTGSPIFNTATHCYVEGERIALPEGSSGLAQFAEGEDAFSGETRLELDGTTNTIGVVNFNASGERVQSTIGWPKNGLLYVRSGSCSWPTANSTVGFNADGPEEARSETGCGNVYVRGTYSRPLTIAAQEDLIIDGSIYPTSVADSLGSEPSGTATLGLIAGGYVRIYHPVARTHPCNDSSDVINKVTGGCEYTNTQSTCDAPNLSASEDPNGWGAQPNIWIYAAILADAHSFAIDNWVCGSALGDLNVYGSIAENYRGVVGTSSSGGGVTAGTPPSTPPKPACTSRRDFIVHVRQIRGLVYQRVKVTLNGHRIAARTTKRGVTTTVDLRGRRRGTYVLRITVETIHGQKITRTRIYHTCAATPARPQPRLTL
jgi:hypothetical protein